MGHYGIGELTAVTILAELGDAGASRSSRHAVRYAGLDITVHQSDQRRAPGHLSRQGPPALRWALYEAAQVARRPGAAPTATTTPRPPSASAATAPASRSRASCSSAATTPCASSARRRWHPPEPPRCARQALTHTDAPRPAPRMLLPPPHRVDGLERPSGRTASSAGSPHQPSCRRPAAPRAADRDKPGRPRAPYPAPATAPTHPQATTSQPHNPDAALAETSPAQIRE